MKLFIEVEISPDEIPLATELFRTLRTLAEHVKARDAGQLFHAILSRLEDPAQLDSVAAEVSTLLTEAGGASPEQIFDDFQQAFLGVVFNRDLVVRQQSVVPYMLLLPRLPETAKTKMRDALIPKVLKHLTVKRAVEGSRMEFFAHAEAFAALVNLEFVSITGAVTTIITLLRKQENRCAAVTMLGKTVELCLQQLTEKCDPVTLADLAAALHNVTEEVFQYDINYIEESMGWSRQLAASAGPRDPQANDIKQSLPDSLPGSTGLRAVESYLGHRNTIFAMCYDDVRQQLVSGGKDGTLVVWGADGKVVETVDMQRHYACSMDIHPTHRSLLVCGVAKEELSVPSGGRLGSLPPPCVLSYSSSGHGWKEHGCISKETSKLISCIKAMGPGQEHAFVTGETIHTSGDGGAQRVPLDERVCYYDILSASNFASLQPVRQYSEHEDLITCVSVFPPSPNVFMSGSRDATVRVWDRRTAASVGMFGSVNKSGRVTAHEGMITCLDANDTGMVLSAGMDTRVLRWDFRMLSTAGGSSPVATVQLDDTAVLKVALGGSLGGAAVSTLRGLYMVDLQGPRPIARPADGFADGRRVGRYHDLKWAHSRKTLFAAGDDTRVDVYVYS